MFLVPVGRNFSGYSHRYRQPQAKPASLAAPLCRRSVALLFHLAPRRGTVVTSAYDLASLWKASMI